jgi:hypothetical protein
MASEMAEVLIPLAMVVVMGTTKVSPTAQVEELMLPIVEVIFWPKTGILAIKANNTKNSQTNLRGEH